MPTKADAPAEEDSNNCTQAAGSQFRCVHNRWLAVCLQEVAPKSDIPITEAREDNPSGDLTAARTVELGVLVVAPLAPTELLNCPAEPALLGWGAPETFSFAALEAL
jgi:hypothetical protein